MTKPRGNLDQLRVSKATASAALPFQAASEPSGESKSLTIKLDGNDYWALRDYCARRERETPASVG